MYRFVSFYFFNFLFVFIYLFIFLSLQNVNILIAFYGTYCIWINSQLENGCAGVYAMVVWSVAPKVLQINKALILFIWLQLKMSTTFFKFCCYSQLMWRVDGTKGALQIELNSQYGDFMVHYHSCKWCFCYKFRELKCWCVPYHFRFHFFQQTGSVRQIAIQWWELLKILKLLFTTLLRLQIRFGVHFIRRIFGVVMLF